MESKITPRHIRNVRGTGYFTGVSISAVHKLIAEINKSNPEARRVGFIKGEAIAKNYVTEYYTAEELRAFLRA